MSLYEGGSDGCTLVSTDEDVSKPTSPRKTLPSTENKDKENQKDKESKEVRNHKDNFPPPLTRPKEATISTTSNSPTSTNTNTNTNPNPNTNTNVSSSSPNDTSCEDVEKKIRAGMKDMNHTKIRQSHKHSHCCSEKFLKIFVLKLVRISVAEKRAALIRELLVSEQKHVEELKSIVVDYMMPLQKILTKTQYKQLFCNIELIMGWNMQFLTCLKPRIESGDGTFGDILIEMVHSIN